LFCFAGFLSIYLHKKSLPSNITRIVLV
jgi:hypothetical protein